MDISTLIGSYLNKGVTLSLVFSYIGGVLTSFTPCVYPLIPVIMALCGARSSESRIRGFLLSLFYVLGLSIIYSILGVFSALAGKIFGEVSTHPITLLVVGNIFLALGLSSLGVYEIKLPVLKRAPKTRKGIWGAFLLGLASGFVAAPCTAPVLGAILTWVATKREVLFGSISLFLFSFGMGTIFIIIGTFSGVLSTLPKSGKWQAIIQKGMGILMILAGEYFIIEAGKNWFG